MRDGAPSLDRPPADARAYVTLVTSAGYLPGVVALLRSLRLTGTGADIVVLHTGGVAAGDLAPLSDLGARLAACDLLPTSDTFNAAHSRQVQHARAPFTKGEKPAFHTPLDNFAKLRLWQLPYERVVFVDADALVLRNVDRLFHYPEFSAAPNVYESVADFRRLNSGVFAARPSEATFAAMLARLDTPGAFWKRTDQTFLQAFFPDWHGLPVYDNLLQYVWFNLPELWDWSLIRVLHFQYEKPWDPDNPRADRLAPLIALWRAYLTGEGIPDDLAALPPARLMRVLVTGATGYVGRFIVDAAHAAGHRVTRLGRRAAADTLPWELADLAPRLPPADALVHAALDHAPGAYRGGEGADPPRFRRLNLDGTRALFDAADAAGIPRLIFLSSRAVYGDHRRGGTLREEDPPAPDSLYGEVKLAAEHALAGRGASLRPTGVYGGAPHKWEVLFESYLRGDPVAPRLATEVHGADLAAAVLLVLERAATGVFNVSDLLLDRHDLLARVQSLTGCPHPPPPRAEAPPPGVMATDRLRALGWRPGGWNRLDEFLAETLARG